MSRYLVTGGAGFIGSHIVDELLRQGEGVRVLDNLCTGKLENLKSARGHEQGRFQFLEGDILDLDTCRRACEGMDYVLHQAALRSVPRSVDDPSATNEVNVGGTLNVLLAASEKGVKRVVYASSSSVYGDSAKLPQSEDQTPSPISPYAVSKLAGEYYCQVFTKIYRLETVSLRYFNVFGPRQDPESQYAAVIPLFIKLALEGKPLEVHGDGLQSRDFTYVSNVVEANLLAAKAGGAAGEVLNVACGETHTVLDIADVISRVIGKPVERYHTPARRGDVRKTQADVSKLRRLLGHMDVVGFEAGLTKMIRYFQAGGNGK